jgi:hypothetical protein
MKRLAILWLALGPVVEAGSGDIRVPEPFLHLGDVRLMRKRIRRRRCPERMHHKALTSPLMLVALPHFWTMLR